MSITLAESREAAEAYNLMLSEVAAGRPCEPSSAHYRKLGHAVAVDADTPIELAWKAATLIVLRNCGPERATACLACARSENRTGHRRCPKYPAGELLLGLSGCGVSS